MGVDDARAGRPADEPDDHGGLVADRGADQGPDQGPDPGEEGPYIHVDDVGMDRRSFVKRAMFGATVGIAGASTWGMLRQAVPLVETNVRTVPYVGATVGPTSPAPRGLALVPLAIDADGTLRGKPEVDDANILDWYRYCGHESNPALRRDAPLDDRLRYAVPLDKLDKLGPEANDVYWFLDRLGEPMNVADWTDLPFGTGAAVRWRSETVQPEHQVTALVIKLDPEQIEAPKGFDLDAFMVREAGLVAFTSFCTHLCCVPGYKEDVTGYAERKGAWDQIFCTCHGSRFDPTRLREYSFRLREPVEDEAA